MFALTPSNHLRMAVVAAAMIAAMQPACAEELIRIGMIPGSGATTGSAEDQKVLQSYLSDAIGVSAKLVVPKDYSATLEGLGNGSFDFAILGAVGYVKAHGKFGVVPLVQRDIDKQFHSLFITQSSSSINSLGDLKGSALPSVTLSRPAAMSCPIARWSRLGSIREKASNGRALPAAMPPP